MYKVLFLTDNPVDHKAYNLKDITVAKCDFTPGTDYCTYLTKDFHDQEQCEALINDFKSQFKANFIRVLSARLINKEFISKEYLWCTKSS